MSSFVQLNIERGEIFKVRIELGLKYKKNLTPETTYPFSKRRIYLLSSLSINLCTWSSPCQK